jgi:hypothetical protein
MSLRHGTFRCAFFWLHTVLLAVTFFRPPCASGGGTPMG